jgi:pimeloyl-ACP methyl ester carboxylesterase
MVVTNFGCDVPGFVIDDLKARLRKTRWTDEIKNSGWQCGTNLLFLKETVLHWQHHYNWIQTQEKINSYPNFIAEVNGVHIHFLHIKGKGKTSYPLILTHGWPGSFLEMLKIIPLLTEDKEHSFDLVIPSVPGFGFSEKITEPGCNSRFVANLWNALMNGLGYPRYFAQGGDIGAGISTAMALQFPENLIGLHLNYIPGSYEPCLKQGESLTEEEQQYKQSVGNWSAREGAYAHLQSTKPITLAHALNDSPVGLCAWILEKFYSWSDCNGDVENIFSKDELLANISLYWVTETIHSSIRIYWENAQSPLQFKSNDFVQVPVAIAKFPKEISFPPRKYVERGFNVVRWNEFKEGGHFAAMEQPQALANDIKSFCAQITSNKRSYK